MEMPKLGPQQEYLMRFLGDWEGVEQLATSPWGPGGPARGEVTFRRVTDGFAMVQDYAQERSGRISFRGHGVFAIDPADDTVLWYWFDSLGLPPLEPARGHWEGDSLILRKITPRGEACHTLRLDGNTFHYRIENKLIGQSEFTTFLTGTYVRRERAG